MNGVTLALALAFTFLIGMWAWGSHLLRRDRKQQERAESIELLQSDHDYEMQQAALRARETAERQYAEAFTAGIYHAAEAAGLEPVMPARTMAEARAQRLSRRAVERADAEANARADEWAAMTADLAGDDTPTEPIPVPNWDAVRTASGHVPAAIALRYGEMPPPAPPGWAETYAQRNK